MQGVSVLQGDGGEEVNEEKDKYYTFKCFFALLVMGVPLGFGFVWGVKLFFTTEEFCRAVWALVM
jgi:hypothetical protein